MRTNIRDGSYWYEIYGEGEAIVLLHGFTGSTKTWSKFIKDYQDEFQIIVLDLPGHGKTVSPSLNSMEQCCQDINGILQQEIGLESFHLVGYSMGGRTALSYAMLFPEQIKSLILESASPGLEHVEDRNTRVANDEKLATKLENEGIESFIEYWENIPLFETQKTLSLDVRNRIKEERLSQTKDGLALSLRTMGTGSQPSWWHRLHEITIPVLLVAGEMDHKFIGIHKRMQQSIPNSKLTVVKKAGHAIHVEQPEFFGKIVMEFVSKVFNT